MENSNNNLFCSWICSLARGYWEWLISAPLELEDPESRLCAHVVGRVVLDVGWEAQFFSTWGLSPGLLVSHSRASGLKLKHLRNQEVAVANHLRPKAWKLVLGHFLYILYQQPIQIQGRNINSGSQGKEWQGSCDCFFFFFNWSIIDL